MTSIALLIVNGCTLLRTLQDWNSAEHIDYPSDAEVLPREFFMVCSDNSSEAFLSFCDYTTKFETDITGSVSPASIAPITVALYL